MSIYQAVGLIIWETVLEINNTYSNTSEIHEEWLSWLFHDSSLYFSGLLVCYNILCPKSWFIYVCIYFIIFCRNRCTINSNLHELGMWLELKWTREPADFLTVHSLSAETMMNDLICAFFMKGENIFQSQPLSEIVCSVCRGRKIVIRFGGVGE